LSSVQNGEDKIRRRFVEEADAVDCIVALPDQLFYTTQIPACLWFLSRNKAQKGQRERRGEVLFINARELGAMVDRTHKEFTAEDIEKITSTYHKWRATAPGYVDVPGFCKSTSGKEIEGNGFILNPGRYAGGAAALEDETALDLDECVEKYLEIAGENEHLTEEVNGVLRRLRRG